MIWIVTLCLLFVAAWLFFNAMNEREWVKTHIHDELVAADKGLVPGLSGLAEAGKGLGGQSGDSALNRAVDTVKQKSAEVARGAGDMASKGMDKAGDMASKGMDKAGDMASKGMDKAGDIKTAATDKLDQMNDARKSGKS